MADYKKYYRMQNILILIMSKEQKDEKFTIAQNKLVVEKNHVYGIPSQQIQVISEGEININQDTQAQESKEFQNTNTLKERKILGIHDEATDKDSKYSAQQELSNKSSAVRNIWLTNNQKIEQNCLRQKNDGLKKESSLQVQNNLSQSQNQPVSEQNIESEQAQMKIFPLSQPNSEYLSHENPLHKRQFNQPSNLNQLERGQLLKIIRKLQNVKTQNEGLVMQSQIMNQEYKTFYQQLQLQKKKLNEENSYLNSQRQKLQKDKQTLILQKEKQTIEILEKQKEIQNNYISLTELINSVNPSQDQDKLRQEEKRRIKDQLDESIRDLENSQNTKTHLDQQILKLKNILNNQNNLIRQMKENEELLKSQINEINAEKMNLEKDKKDFTAQNDGLKRQINEINAEKMNLEKDKKDFTAQNDGLKRQINEINAEKMNLEKDKKDFTAQNDGLKRQINEINAEKMNLDKDKKDLTISFENQKINLQFNLGQQKRKALKSLQSSYSQQLTKVKVQLKKLQNQNQLIKQNYNRILEDEKFKLINIVQNEKKRLSSVGRTAHDEIERLKQELQLKKGDQNNIRLCSEDKDKKMIEMQQNTKKTADNLLKFLYSSIKISQKNKEILKSEEENVRIKDEQILRLENRISQLQVDKLELEIQLNHCNSQKNYIEQQYGNSQKTLRSYEQSMRSYKSKVEEFVKSQKTKFKDALFNATQQFNKSLLDLSAHYEEQIKMEKENSKRQLERYEKMQNKLDQLLVVGKKMKQSQQKMLREQIQDLSSRLEKANQQINISRNNALQGEQQLNKNKAKSLQKQQDLQQKLSQKQEIIQNMKKQVQFVLDSLTRIQEQLQDKNFKTLAQEIIDSQDNECHEQVVSLIISIYSQRCNYETKILTEMQQQRLDKFRESKLQNKENQYMALKLEHESQQKLLKSRISALQTEIIKYKETNGSRSTQNNTLKNQLQSAQRELLNNNKSLENKNQQSSKNLLIELNKIRANNQSLQKEVENLRKSQKVYQDDLKKKQTSNKSLRQIQLANEKYKRQNQRLKVSAQAFQRQLNNLKNQRDREIQQKNQLKSKVAQMEADINKNKRDNKYISVNRNSNQLEMNYKNLQLQCTKNISKLRELNEKIVLLEKQNKRLKQSSFNQSQLQEKNWDKYQSRVKQFEQTIDNLKRQKQYFRKKYQELEQKSKQRQQKEKSFQSEQKLYQMNLGKQLFVISTILHDNIKGQQFLQKLIQYQLKPSKLINASLLIKLTQSTKNVSLQKLIPKTQLASQSFIILFSTKQSIFGAFSFKKDIISKQIVSIFSINNERIVNKSQRVEATGIAIDYQDNLLIGSSHMKFKLSSRILNVKDNAMKYFEPYEKKEIYGNSNWRDELNIEISQFQIYRIYYK